MTKTCSRCKEAKLISDFYKESRRKSGLNPWCGACHRAYNQAKYHRNKPYYMQKNREWNRRNRERVRLLHVARRFGLSPETYLGMLEDQGRACAICRTPFLRNPDVDHDHKTNVVRGLLCGNCNKLLGYAKDDPTTLRAAIVYLGKHSRLARIA